MSCSNACRWPAPYPAALEAALRGALSRSVPTLWFVVLFAAHWRFFSGIQRSGRGRRSCLRTHSLRRVEAHADTSRGSLVWLLCRGSLAWL